MLQNYNIPNEYVLGDKSCSKGAQIKYFKDNMYFKIDSGNNEGFREYLVSLLLSYSNLYDEEYVFYEPCFINGRRGCVSENFLLPEEEFISMERMYTTITGKTNLSNAIWTHYEAVDRLNFILDIAYEFGCDKEVFKYYLKKILQLDMLILNNDRHPSNYGVIYPLREAPIFDNGKAFILNSNPCTISGSYETQVTTFGFPIEPTFLIDYSGLYEALQNVKCTSSQQKILNTLYTQLDKYKEIFAVR